MYVAAPMSTFDSTLRSGDAIVIEQRGRDEVARAFGQVTVPDEVAVANPAFDVTPAELITAIISDQGVHRPPYDFSGLGPAPPEPRVPSPESRLESRVPSPESRVS